jgi:hypothetical protein
MELAHQLLNAIQTCALPQVYPSGKHAILQKMDVALI